MTKLTLFMMITLLPYPVFAQKHPIDTALTHCLNKESASTTLGMMDCLIQAHDAWDKELNKQYTLLMADLSDESKNSLRQSQQAWIKYRDSYFSAMREYYSTQDGSIWKIVHGEQRVNVVKEKALSLESLYKSLCLAEAEDCRH